MPRARRRFDVELDFDRPDRTAGDELVKLQAGDRAASLAKRRSARALFFGFVRRRQGIILGVRAVRDCGHVWGVSGRGDAREGGEFTSGGHGRNEFER